MILYQPSAHRVSQTRPSISTNLGVRTGIRHLEVLRTASSSGWAQVGSLVRSSEDREGGREEEGMKRAGKEVRGPQEEQLGAGQTMFPF